MRTAVMVTSAVLMLFLAGCSTGSGGRTPPSSPTVSPTVPTPVPTETPAPESAQVPFDGDCDAAVSVQLVADILDSVDLQIVPDGTGAAELDHAASLALLGGLACKWYGTAANGGPAWASVEVFPEEVVPAEFVADTGFACGDDGVCSEAETVHGSWVMASTIRERGREQPLGDEERERLEATVDALLAEVTGADGAALAARPGSRGDDWWTMPACDAFATAATAAVPVGVQPGFPGDAAWRGSAWEIAVANGTAQWCPFYSFDVRGNAAIVEFLVQPGIGAPSPASLVSAGATQVTVPGADAAHALDADGRTRIVAVVGANRVTVTGDGKVTAEGVLEAASRALALLGAETASPSPSETAPADG